MTADDARPRRPRLSDEEHALWRGVTRSIAPLKRRHIPARPDAVLAAIHSAAAAAAGVAMPARPTPTTAKSSSNKSSSNKSGSNKSSSNKPMVKRAVPPALGPLDRQLKRRLGRGSEIVDARIDLHGQTQDRAHAGLLQFLRRAQSEGVKTVLVITGKGAPGEGAGQRGVLRRMVPHWLALAQFRALIVGVEEAPERLGGAGALLVVLRRSPAR